MPEDTELGLGRSCFIISPIGNKLEPLGTPGRSRFEESAVIWEEVIEPACNSFGIEPIRSDRITDTGEIPAQIFNYLRDSDVVIADLSHANPNVMYELGLRHSRPGKITIQIGEYGLLPFDVTTIRTIQFKRTTAGLLGARNDLIETLRSALNGGGSELLATTIFASRDPLPPETISRDIQRSVAPDNDEAQVEEPGIVDILAGGEAAVEHVSIVLTEAGTTIRSVGEHIRIAGEETSSADSAKKGFAGRLLIMRNLATDLAQPANSLESSANEFYEDVTRMDAMVQYVAARFSAGEEEITDDVLTFLDSILSLVTSAEEAAVGITSFREGTRNLAKMARDLAPSGKVLARGANRFLEGITIMTAWKAQLAVLRDESEA